MPSRTQTYAAVDSEREYQESRWPGHTHEIESYLLYMQDYMNECIHVISRSDGSTAYPIALNIIRKVTALGIACMEQHGAPIREGF